MIKTITKNNFYKECEKGDVLIIDYKNTGKYLFLVERVDNENKTLVLRDRFHPNYRAESFFNFENLENVNNITRIRL